MQIVCHPTVGKQCVCLITCAQICVHTGGGHQRRRGHIRNRLPCCPHAGISYSCAACTHHSCSTATGLPLDGYTLTAQAILSDGQLCSSTQCQARPLMCDTMPRTGQPTHHSHTLNSHTSCHAQGHPDPAEFAAFAASRAVMAEQRCKPACAADALAAALSKARARAAAGELPASGYVPSFPPSVSRVRTRSLLTLLRAFPQTLVRVVECCVLLCVTVLL